MAAVPSSAVCKKCLAPFERTASYGRPRLLCDLCRPSAAPFVRQVLCVGCGAEIKKSRNVRALLCLDPCEWQRAKQLAHVEVNKAVRVGRLPPARGQTCADCGGLACEYDHRDYSRPLDVAAVCHPCNVRRGQAAPLSSAA